MRAPPPAINVPPLWGLFQYCADTVGCARVARSIPGYLCVAPSGLFADARWCSAKPRMGRYINSRGWSMRSMRNPRKTFEERSNPEGVAQRVTAGVSTSSEQLCHPFGVRFYFASIPGVARALRAPPPAIYVSPRWGLFQYCAYTGGCARVARSTPGYICVAQSGLFRSRGGVAQSPEWGDT